MEPSPDRCTRCGGKLRRLEPFNRLRRFRCRGCGADPLQPKRSPWAQWQAMKGNHSDWANWLAVIFGSEEQRPW
jgi:hypothetical protein